MELPPGMSGHLDQFRDRLLAAVDLRGLYLYGSLTTGDFSPAHSDIDVLAVTAGPASAPLPGHTATGRLTALHRELAGRGGAYARLNCLYVAAGTLGDPVRLHPYWYGDRFTQWQLKVMTVAELWHSGVALHGPWPPAGLPEVSPAEVREHAREQLTGYWRPLTFRPGIWLQDKWVDFALITLARTAALLRDGDLVTKSQAIAGLAGLGVPPWLAEQIRRRRAGEEVPVALPQRLARAARARQLMAAGIRDLSGAGR